MLNALNTSDKKIITLEDPIEYGITGISQIPVNTNAGGSFAEGLRSVLRLDPDVVMVGEIRDADTAKTAIQASITGHLVLSSFHANSTSAAFSRMIDLIGVNPIFASSIRLIVAQRLIRKLSDAKKARQATESERDYIRMVMERVNADILSDFDMEKPLLYDPVPTEENPFGYSGRTVIMEQLVVSDDIQAFIRGDVADINTNAIEKTARKNGMLTLEQKGVLAVLRGETTLEEVSRVI
jgi:type II secretory ATPase GspE/PulE/Tfp pilus assembly ATPase PilB-like protein